ncbi:hypothetical protein H112_00410 [Trichophyton rubrum D6]|uniref:Uncharacterized protein n=4 Tax=Trichophyton TaxID=5550 RepID=A0A178F969_TRIRU|nr:uncharacterized protein TERG_08338 [Trichophyton rubrum CBS 118892]EZF27613.1 hypothetical protein H100_00410 [Trichophyton rubrum MR850]EZF46720.1 hypothetical protein H102_00409 [Trichophyton rubrum CBS 100081]EZF57299.1 hypothetical protein H103_00408 [Trichophyton rubrum CBS 288.86]EZF67908.1 hypothetical protein H104_00409 [Trichophyton rubrum CBS 289.86]EZF78696.1 hypothetical protein H105_00406 [Trichophyton soudanense CBS 452.61]EZG00096.1 hypothetical protein H113_00413 [Trichophy
MAFYQRASPVNSLRYTTPYIAFPSRGEPWESFCSGPTHAHPDNSDVKVQEQKQATRRPEQSWATTDDGSWSRHITDKAPFTLWDSSQQDFRYPTSSEKQWILNTFSATGLTISWPEIFIETRSPPVPVPLTVACVPCLFVPPDHPVNPLSADISYCNPRLPDPIPVIFHYSKWGKPSKEEYQVVFHKLKDMMNIRSISFVHSIIIVELRADDGRVYERRSLPGRVANHLTLYHHSQTPFWDLKVQGRERVIKPTASLHDMTNYLSTELHSLCPGVRVESGTTSIDGGYLDTTIATTAGVLLRSSEGSRLTVSNHSFPYSDDVYHPSLFPDGLCIGQISERFTALDVALVKLHPSTSFTNNKYFESQQPKRLLRSSEVPINTWCTLDGMASGLVFLRVAGIQLFAPPQVPGIEVEFTRFQTENIYRYIGPAGAEVCAGICGSPIVIDEDESGGVVGFFELGSRGSDWALAPYLDEIIDRGWTVV